jgi:hypothetical protein
VSTCISRLLGQWPAHFVYHFDKKVLANQDLVKLSWTLGPAGVPVAATGTEVAVMEDSRIVAVIKNGLLQPLQHLLNSLSAVNHSKSKGRAEQL